MSRVRVCRAEELAPGMAVRAELDGEPVAVLNVGGEFFAVADTCSHEESSLSEGFLDADDYTVECPKHGALFDVRTGNNLTLPATRPVASYATSVDGGDLYVETRP